MKETRLLTIAVPTFNRPAQLQETLRRLIPQLDERWILHLHDNCSDEPVAVAQADILSGINPDQFAIFRNEVNIGATANVLRCFEKCVTEWLVVLGDDDAIEPGYVASFLQVIASRPDVAFVNFSSNIWQRADEFVTTGVSEFATRLDNWSNVLFISCGLFNRTAMVPYIRYGHTYGYSLAPHIAILLQYLKEQSGKCLFSSKRVVNYQRQDGVVSWSRVYASNFALVLELLPDRRSQRALFRQMHPYFCRLKDLWSFLVARGDATGDDQRLQFRFRSSFASCLLVSPKDLLGRFLFEALLLRSRPVAIIARWLVRHRHSSGSLVDRDLHAGL